MAVPTPTPTQDFTARAPARAAAPKHRSDAQPELEDSYLVALAKSGSADAYERIMKRYKSPRQVQRFLSVHDQVANLFLCRRDYDTAPTIRSGRTRAFATWTDVTGVAMAA